MADVVTDTPTQSLIVDSKNVANIKSAMSLHSILSPPAERGDNSNAADIESCPTHSVTVGKTKMPSTPSTQREVSPGELSTASGGSKGSNSPGSFSDEVDGSPIDREFNCMFDEYSECRTGQYTLKLSRKVISNHFGRNKACTRHIEQWPLFCRKHYQRATYKPDLWQRRKVNLILRQFDVIEKLHPGTTYKVSLKKSEENRLNLFARLTASGTPVEEARTVVAPDTDVKAFQAPIEVLRELEFRLGPKKSIEHVKETLSLINDMLRHGESKEVPSIEFLPEVVADKWAKSPKPKAVPSKPKEPKALKSKAASATNGRVSRKGAVQKPRN